MRWPSWMPGRDRRPRARASRACGRRRRSRAHGCSTICAAAAALRAGLRADELAEDAARDLLQPARCRRSVGHVTRRRARLDAVAVARRARHRDLERHADASRRARRRRARSRSPRRRRRRAARAAAAPLPPKMSSPKNAAKRSPRLADVEVRRREAARAQAGVAVAVVERARLGVREHLVRLGHLAEAHLGLGLVGDVGMQLAREPAERLLDRRVVARRARRRAARSSRASSCSGHQSLA